MDVVPLGVVRLVMMVSASRSAQSSSENKKQQNRQIPFHETSPN
jgi:hypothetical protein